MKSNLPELPNRDQTSEGAAKDDSPKASEAVPVDASVGESVPRCSQASELGKADSTGEDVEPPRASTEPSGLEELNPELQTEGKPSDEVLEEFAGHYMDQFWNGVNRTNTILVTWGASLVLIFIGLVPLSERAARYLQVYDKYENRRVQVASEKRRAMDRLDSRKRWLQAQHNVEERREGGTAIARTNQINDARAELQSIEEREKDLKESYKEEEAKLDGRLRELKSLKNDLFPFNVPLGKLDIPLSYTPIFWVFLFTAFLSYFLYKRLFLMGAMAKVLHIQCDLRGKKIHDLKGLGAGAPFWIAPLPKAFSGSAVSREEVRQFLGWEPMAIRRSILVYFLLSVATGLYVWVSVVAIQVVRIYDNPQVKIGLAIGLIATFSLLIVTCLSWLLPPIRVESYPETLAALSARRRVLTGTFGTAAVFGYFYMLAPRAIFPNLLLPNSNRTKRLNSAKMEEKKALSWQAPWRGSFKMHKRSKIIHYVGGAGMKTRGSTPQSKNFEDLSGEDVIKILTVVPAETDSKKPTPTPRPTRTPTPTPATRLSKLAPVAAADQGGRSSWTTNTSSTPRLAAMDREVIAEVLAFQRVRANQVPLALEILWRAINKSSRRKAKYRLYDFFAFLALKHARWDQLKKLKALVTQNASGNKALEDRIKKWTDWIEKPDDSSTRWSAKRKASKEVWKTPNGW